MGIGVSVLVSGVPMDGYERELVQLNYYCGIYVQRTFTGGFDFETECPRFKQLHIFLWIGNVATGRKFYFGGVSQKGLAFV